MPKSGVWRRKQDGWWYTTIDGRKVRLAKDKAEALKLFHREQASRTPGRRGPAPTVAELLDRYLGHVDANLSQRTLKLRMEYLNSFSKQCGRMPADQIRPLHVTAWLDRPTWGDTTRAMALASVRAAYRWAVDEGWLEANPIARAKGPRERRRDVPEAEVARQAIDKAPAALGEFLRGLAETGCRPGEIAGATAADLDAEAGVLLVRGKTGERPVYLGPAALALAKELAARNPEGPLFRTAKGLAWNQGNWREAIRNLCKATGLKLTAYSFRHIYASEAIARGVDSLLVAELMGHKGTKMLQRFYARHRAETLRDAARRARGDEATS